MTERELGLARDNA